MRPHSGMEFIGVTVAGPGNTHWMGQAGHPEVESGAVVFELEHFHWAEPGRIELCGRWFGLQARRFVRPTLFLVDKHGRQRLLATLEHKPWEPEEGQPWTAAFPWDGEPRAFDGAELAVSTGIDVELPAPEQSPTRRRPRRFPYRAVSRDVADAGPLELAPASGEDADGAAPKRPASAPPDAVVRLRAEVARLQARERASAEAQDAAEGAQRTAELELASARESLQAALREGRERERDLVAGGQAELAAARREFEREFGQLRSERDKVTRDRDRAQRTRDQVAADRDEVVADRDRMRAELAEAERARDGALRRVGPRASWPEPEISRLAVWEPRLVGAGCLLVFFATILLLFH